jgi:hypothetical protein
MGSTYRIRTEIGTSKTISFELNQDFEFIEILSLKIQQEDIYNRNCADYGVIVGRVTANNGLGIPNAKVSVFIPVSELDQSNSVITSIYPYKNPLDVNEDGYRYNLLPYEKSYSKHAATGTFPSKNDVLTNNTAIEIFDKYFKFTVKTNDSGDYMIMGVPVGPQSLVMDVDLSDIGEFSLTPQDLIRMGRATEAQVAGNTFRTSSDLGSLPQIVSLNKSLEVSPLWGDPELCQLAINRVDFDLRDDANTDIQPTSVFLGSIFSTPSKFRVRKNCKPRDNMGNLCDLVSGPGQILAVRQTIEQDADGLPILEVYNLEQAGNVIDENGTWLTEIPMNLDYVTTNEFGERILSPDPEVGIPTKGKYRFKIKWQQPNNFSGNVRRAYFLVPNVREYGWTGTTDPNLIESNVSAQAKKELQGSYYFGLDWSGYTNQQDAVNCEDTFYEFNYNKVYTVSGLIDQWKKGGKGRFIGIKEIDDDGCADTTNKFPANDGFRNFDLLFFIFSLLFTILQFILIPVLVAAHFITYIYSIVIRALCKLCGIKLVGFYPFRFICSTLNIRCVEKDFTIRLPMITYPECSSCKCNEGKINERAVEATTTGVLSYLSFPAMYQTKFTKFFENNKPNTGTFENDDDFSSEYAIIASQAIAGYDTRLNDTTWYKVPKSDVTRIGGEKNLESFFWTYNLPMGERVNIFNARTSYFNDLNKIKVTLAKNSNVGKYHFDNTITVLSNQQYLTGDLLTSVNPETSTDPNFRKVNIEPTNPTIGIPGTTQKDAFNYTLKYALTQTTDTEVTYFLPTGSTVENQIYPMDREYFQVVTAITISQASKIWNVNSPNSFPDILNSFTDIVLNERENLGTLPNFKEEQDYKVYVKDLFEGWDEQYILILQRGVDPYSPKYINEYNIGKILGSTYDDPNFTVTAETRVNIPIQKVPFGDLTVGSFNSVSLFHESKFFIPGNDFTAFTSSTVAYYSNVEAKAGSAVRSFQGATGLISPSDNRFYSDVSLIQKYDDAEDLSGISMFIGDKKAGQRPSAYEYDYINSNLYPIFTGNPMTINVKEKNIMRTDRLPSSDALDGYSWDLNPSVLQQNNNFTFYGISDTFSETLASYTLGAEQVPPDIEDQPYEANVMTSFDCEGMVGLTCYSGNGYTFGVKDNCQNTDYVEKGCYVFLKRPLRDLGKDLKNLNEWGYRFRFFYGICRGVLAQSFVNNWVNGTLYAFPIQVDTYYDKNNQPSFVGRRLFSRKRINSFCTNLVYFDGLTNNFYYRSSPYNWASNSFIGKDPNENSAINKRNLLFPTTIINLGPKDSFWGEITFEPSNRAYIIDQLDSTSYGDPSDLINLFVISRITDGSFVGRLISFGDDSLNQLFSRNGDDRRIDGDLAQLLSINSEEGVIKFSPEFYGSATAVGDPIVVLGSLNKPTLGVFFSSTTEDLQFKDFLTPGRIDFRPNDNARAIGYNYGIKSQRVPFYKWELKGGSSIFGSEINNWKTTYSPNQSVTGIFSREYQSLDRTGTTIPSYFISSNAQINDTYARGYIFNVSANTLTDDIIYSPFYGNWNGSFLVGAPFHFYFGTVAGASALDRFKAKYSVLE